MRIATRLYYWRLTGDHTGEKIGRAVVMIVEDSTHEVEREVVDGPGK